MFYKKTSVRGMTKVSLRGEPSQVRAWIKDIAQADKDFAGVAGDPSTGRCVVTFKRPVGR